MSTVVEMTSYLGASAVRVVTDELEAIIVPEWGSNLISVVHRASGQQILHTPASAQEFWKKPVLYGVPVLFPPNRIEDGVFVFDGRTYQLDLTEPERHNHIHGFGASEAWELVESRVEGDEAKVVTRFQSENFPHVRRQWPTAFTLELQFSIQGNVIDLTAVVTNLSHERMPWGLGYHTTFLASANEAPDGKDYQFRVAVGDQWELTERLLPNGQLNRTRLAEDMSASLKLPGVSLDDAFTARHQDGWSTAEMIDKARGLRVTYQADEMFTNWVVYTGSGDLGFVCPEPYTWITNAPNLSLPADITGFRALNPGESVRAGTRIQVLPL